MATAKQGIDDMWKYVTDDGNLGTMTFPKPGRVIAYELETSWDGNGNPPAIVSTGQVQCMIGQDLKTFAQNRLNSKTDQWKITNVWIVYAPFKLADITS